MRFVSFFGALLALLCTTPAAAIPILSCSSGCTFSPDAQPFWVDYAFTSQPQKWTFTIVSDDPNATFVFGGPNQFETAITYFDGTHDLSVNAFPVQFDIYQAPGQLAIIVRAAPSFNVCADGGPPNEICAISRLAIGNSVGMMVTGNAPITIYSSVQSVPEPATWAMLIAGFGLAGVAMRRRPAVAMA